MLIKSATIINEGKEFESDLLIKNNRIEKIARSISATNEKIIDGAGKYLFPGVIDDQVHFREPGLIHKATIYSESRAAVAGGITSFMEMPNTIPSTLSQSLLEEKYATASRNSLANYSFFMGASNDNIEEVLKTNPSTTCGVKVFMGSSTGNMLVDEEKTLESLFSKVDILIATHCEDEKIVKRNMRAYYLQFGDKIPIHYHPIIRSSEACYLSSSMAVNLAKKYNTQLHVLHISTAKELTLFDNTIPLSKKRITAEVCIHHLWFNDTDYEKKGTLIKWNPAIKTMADQQALLAGLADNTIDIIATDHAPHTLKEKKQNYASAPSGGPLVQHSITAMLDLYHQGKIPLTQIAEKMSHNPATLFKINKRGFIREGYYADLVLVDLDSPWLVHKENILAKCRWSPFEGHKFKSKVTHTFVNGELVYSNGKINNIRSGDRLLFNRKI